MCSHSVSEPVKRKEMAWFSSLFLSSETVKKNPKTTWQELGDDGSSFILLDSGEI